MPSMFLSFTYPTSPVKAEGILVRGRGRGRDEEEGGGKKKRRWRMYTRRNKIDTMWSRRGGRRNKNKRR